MRQYWWGSNKDTMATTKPSRRRKKSAKEKAHLRLGRSGIIVAVRGSSERCAGSVLARTDTTTLGQVLLSLCLANLNLLLLSATAELLRLESALRLEIGAAMLGDVSVGHGCYCDEHRLGEWLILVSRQEEKEAAVGSI